ncbi:tyrosine-protein phosphatase [Yinghuangia seranimata]|uniref:tyrosine-protein phosphatase n=1 Tax=Yinghuangia seranimata TaxID=408067 RepID=UPI00248ACE44|nr:tyrosine-protein phosphatase [Yinghuangia seranimata]MDI2127782.1 tyrosine-protein phosphatase [Yinghuangia seranimata]
MKLRRTRAATCAMVAALSLGTTAGTLMVSGTAVAAPSSSSGVSRYVLSGAAAEVAADGTATLTWTGGTGAVRVYASTNPTFPALTGTQVASVTGQSATVKVDPTKRWYFQLVPERNPLGGVVVASRGVGLQAASNTRDIGGYKAAYGLTVKYGQVFRSDALTKLTDADLAKLGTLGVKTVADLRTDFELNLNGPDKVPAGSELLRAPISDGGMYGKLNEVIASKDPVKQQELLGNGNAEKLLLDANRSFVNDPAQRAQFASVIKRIANGEKVLYNCSAGKDRTGWMTAVLLTAVGVDRATVTQDYLLSNTFLKAANDRTKMGLKYAGLMQNPDLLDPLLGVQQQYLDAAFDEVTKQFGTFDRFLRDGLDLDRATLAKLRLQLLTV